MNVLKPDIFRPVLTKLIFLNENKQSLFLKYFNIKDLRKTTIIKNKEVNKLIFIKIH